MLQTKILFIFIPVTVASVDTEHATHTLDILDDNTSTAGPYAHDSASTRNGKGPLDAFSPSRMLVVK